MPFEKGCTRLAKATEAFIAFVGTHDADGIVTRTYENRSEI